MIIKFSVNGAWQMYDDVDSIRVKRITDATPEVFNGDVIDFTTEEPPAVGSERIWIRFMNSKQFAESEIIAYSPVYLMNNNGKTIETI